MDAIERQRMAAELDRAILDHGMPGERRAAGAVEGREKGALAGHGNGGVSWLIGASSSRVPVIVRPRLDADAALRNGGQHLLDGNE